MTKFSGGWLLGVMVGAVAGLTLFSGLPGLAQQAPAAQSPEFTLKTSVNRVLVDVVVTDSHGNPVHGLTKDDFTVAEDGVPQKVLAFDAHDFDTMTYVPPKMPAMPADSFVNLPTTPERGPLYVLLYDLVNIPQQYQVVARAQLVKFIENKPAGARFAILVSSDGIHVVQGFTSDKRKLLAAVDPNGSRAHVPSIFLMGVNFGQGDKLATTERLNSIARYLAPMPGRKNLIWFSAEFPLSFAPTIDDTEAYRAEIKKTLNLLADNQIAVYPVDASGVVSYEAYAPPGDVGGQGIVNDDRQKGLKVPGAAKGSNLPPKGGKGPGYSLLGESYMTQDEIAKTTGGEAVYSSNDITGALEKVTENGGSYYTLAYSPTDKNFDGRLRRIQVKLTEEKYHLSYRRAYYGLPPQSGSTPVEDTIEASMKYGAPESHQLIFGVHVAAGSPQRGTREQMVSLEKARGGKGSLKPVKLRTYTIDYEVMARQLGEQAPELEIAAAVYDGDGHVLNSTVNKVEAEPAEQQAARKAYRMEIALAAPLDAKSMRVAVRDVRTGKLGAMEIELPLK